jgi:hypothetical protein
VERLDAGLQSVVCGIIAPKTLGKNAQAAFPLIAQAALVQFHCLLRLGHALHSLVVVAFQ